MALKLSFIFSQIKDIVLKRPTEIHDIYLGSQVIEDEQTLHFANYYRQINFYSHIGGLAQSYQALGVSRSAIRKTYRGEIDRVTYKVDNVNKAMSAYAREIDFRNKRIVTRLVFRDYLDDPLNQKVIFDGRIQSILFEESSMVATCVPLIGSLAFETGWPYQINCAAKFGDEFCQIDKNDPANKTEGIATSGTATTLTDTLNLTQADDYWNIGEIIINTGDNAGARRKIIDFDQASATLYFDYGLNSAIAVGDEYTVFRGCDKRLKTCQDVYDNDANYHGFHAIPLNRDNL